MKSPRTAAAVGASLALILVLSFSQVADGAIFVGEPSDWTMVGAPVVTSLASFQVARVTLDNHLDESVPGLAIMVVRNSLGQAIYFTSASITLDLGSYGTVDLAVTGLVPGMYNSTIFVVALSGVAISNSTTFVFPAQ